MAADKTKKRITRTVSLLTLGLFLFSQVTFANPGIGIEIAANREMPGFLRIDIPTELASLDGIWEAPPSFNSKVILHIQNAHANYGAQKKIKELLEYLNKTYAIKTIFVEGAAEDLNPDYLKLFPDKARNLELADLLAQQGELTGAELYLLQTGDAAVKGKGIEDAGLYRQNYEALKKVFGAEALVNRYLKGYESRLEALSSKIFTNDLRRVLSDWQKFEKGHREFMPYIRSLAADAKRVLKLDLESLFSQVEWPQISRLLVLQGMEKELDTAKALEEKDKLVSFLKAKGVSPRIIAEVENFKEQRLSVRQGQGEMMQPRDVLEALTKEAGPQGFRFSDYPAFSLYAGYLVLKSELDAKGLFEEIKVLFEKILDSLAAGSDQKALLGLYRDEELARKLLRLELSRRDWKDALGRKTEIQMDSMVSRLKDLSIAVTKEMNLAPSELETKKLSPKFQGQILDLYGSAFSFYEFARQREAMFYEKINAVMGESASSRKAVLITGGFHTDGMTDLFREHNISYGVLTPRLMEKSDEKLYRNTMLQNEKHLFSISYLELASSFESPEVLLKQGVDPAEKWEVRFAAFMEKGNFSTLDQAYDFFLGSEADKALQAKGWEIDKSVVEGVNQYKLVRRSEVREGVAPRSEIRVDEELVRKVFGSLLDGFKIKVKGPLESDAVFHNENWSRVSEKDKMKLLDVLANGSDPVVLAKYGAKLSGEWGPKRTILVPLDEPVTVEVLVGERVVPITYTTFKVKGEGIEATKPVEALVNKDAKQPSVEMTINNGVPEHRPYLPRPNGAAREFGTMVEDGAMGRHAAIPNKDYTVNLRIARGTFTHKTFDYIDAQGRPVSDKLGYGVSLITDKNDQRFYHQIGPKLNEFFDRWKAKVSSGSITPAEREQVGRELDQLHGYFATYGKVAREFNRDSFHSSLSPGNLNFIKADGMEIPNIQDTDYSLPSILFPRADRLGFFINEVYMLLEGIHEFENPVKADDQGRHPTIYRNRHKEVLAFYKTLNEMGLEVNFQKAAIDAYFQKADRAFPVKDFRGNETAKVSSVLTLMADFRQFNSNLLDAWLLAPGHEISWKGILGRTDLTPQQQLLALAFLQVFQAEFVNELRSEARTTAETELAEAVALSFAMLREIQNIDPTKTSALKRKIDKAVSEMGRTSARAALGRLALDFIDAVWAKDMGAAQKALSDFESNSISVDIGPIVFRIMEKIFAEQVSSHRAPGIDEGDVLETVYTGTLRTIKTIDLESGTVVVERTDAAGKKETQRLRLSEIEHAIGQGIVRKVSAGVNEEIVAKQAGSQSALALIKGDVLVSGSGTRRTIIDIGEDEFVTAERIDTAGEKEIQKIRLSEIERAIGQGIVQKVSSGVNEEIVAKQAGSQNAFTLNKGDVLVSGSGTRRTIIDIGEDGVVTAERIDTAGEKETQKIRLSEIEHAMGLGILRKVSERMSTAEKSPGPEKTQSAVASSQEALPKIKTPPKVPEAMKEVIRQKVKGQEAMRAKIESDQAPDILMFGDKHGRADDLERILKAAHQAVKDGREIHIVGHGDGFDRGKQNVRNWEIFQELMRIAQQNPKINVDLMLGNHDVFLIEAVLRKDPEAFNRWVVNGGDAVLQEFGIISPVEADAFEAAKKKRNQLVLHTSLYEWNNRDLSPVLPLAAWMLQNFKLFTIDDRGFLHVHAGIPMDENGNPKITREQLELMAKELEAIQRDAGKDLRFFKSSGNRDRLGDIFRNAHDVLWARENDWLDKMAEGDGRIEDRIRIDETNKRKAKEILKQIFEAQTGQQMPNVEEEWARILLGDSEIFKRAGIEFQILSEKPQVDKARVDNFLAQLGVNGVVFGHIHKQGLLNLDNRIFCVDVDDHDPGHLFFNKDGIVFDGMNRSSKDLEASKAEVLSGMDEEIIRLKAALGEEAAVDKARLQTHQALMKSDGPIIRDRISTVNTEEISLDKDRMRRFKLAMQVGWGSGSFEFKARESTTAQGAVRVWDFKVAGENIIALIMRDGQLIRGDQVGLLVKEGSTLRVGRDNSVEGQLNYTFLVDDKAYDLKLVNRESLQGAVLVERDTPINPAAFNASRTLINESSRVAIKMEPGATSRTAISTVLMVRGAEEAMTVLAEMARDMSGDIDPNITRLEARLVLSPAIVDPQEMQHVRSVFQEQLRYLLDSPENISALTPNEIAIGQYSFQLTLDKDSGEWVLKLADFGSASKAASVTNDFRELAELRVDGSNQSDVSLVKQLSKMLAFGQQIAAEDPRLRKDPLMLAQAFREIVISLRDHTASGISPPAPSKQISAKPTAQGLTLNEAINFYARFRKMDADGPRAQKQLAKMSPRERLKLTTQMALGISHEPTAEQMDAFTGSTIGVRKVSEFPGLDVLLQQLKIENHYAGYVEIDENALYFMRRTNVFQTDTSKGLMNDAGKYGPTHLHGNEANYFRELGSYVYLKNQFRDAFHESFHHRAGGKTDYPFVRRTTTDDMNALEELQAYLGMHLRADGSIDENYPYGSIDQVVGYIDIDNHAKRSEVREAIQVVKRLVRIFPGRDVIHEVGRARSLADIIEMGRLSDEDLVDRIRPGFTVEELALARQVGYDDRQKAVVEFHQEALARDYLRHLENPSPGNIQGWANQWATSRIEYLVGMAGRSELRLVVEWLDSRDEHLTLAVAGALGLMGITAQSIRDRLRALESVADNDQPARQEVRNEPLGKDNSVSGRAETRSEVRVTKAVEETAGQLAGVATITNPVALDVLYRTHFSDVNLVDADKAMSVELKIAFVVHGILALNRSNPAEAARQMTVLANALGAAAMQTVLKAIPDNHALPVTDASVKSEIVLYVTNASYKEHLAVAKIMAPLNAGLTYILVGDSDAAAKSIKKESDEWVKAMALKPELKISNLAERLIVQTEKQFNKTTAPALQKRTGVIIAVADADRGAFQFTDFGALAMRAPVAKLEYTGSEQTNPAAHTGLVKFSREVAKTGKTMSALTGDLLASILEKLPEFEKYDPKTGRIAITDQSLKSVVARIWQEFQAVVQTAIAA